MIVVSILGALAIVTGVYFVTTYNRLVELKHNVSKAWANIDVLLKQRNDELPKLVETCRQYMRFERDTLEKVIRARSWCRTPASGRTSARWAGPRPCCAPASDCSRWPRPIRS